MCCFVSVFLYSRILVRKHCARPPRSTGFRGRGQVPYVQTSTWLISIETKTSRTRRVLLPRIAPHAFCDNTGKCIQREFKMMLILACNAVHVSILFQNVSKSALGTPLPNSSIQLDYPTGLPLPNSNIPVYQLIPMLLHTTTTTQHHSFCDAHAQQCRHMPAHARAGRS